MNMITPIIIELFRQSTIWTNSNTQYSQCAKLTFTCCNISLYNINTSNRDRYRFSIRAVGGGGGGGGSTLRFVSLARMQNLLARNISDIQVIKQNDTPEMQIANFK